MVPIVSMVRIELDLTPSRGPFLYGPYPVRNVWKGFCKFPCPRLPEIYCSICPNEFMMSRDECGSEAENFPLCLSQNAASFFFKRQEVALSFLISNREAYDSANDRH